MQAPSGNQRIIGSTSSRVRELGLVLPTPPTPLGAYVESSDAGNLLFLSGMLPVANGKLAISGRLGDNLSVEQGREAALMASLNALAVAKEHLGDLDRLKKLLKLTVLMATTEQFAEHALVADGASNLFVQIFGPKASHVRLVYGVQSLPVGAPLIVDTVFEIEPMNAFGQDRVSYNSIQVDNLKIFYREAGPKDGPVILLLHGVPTSSRMYQRMLESSLSTKYRLIALDFPGFGHSSWPSRKEFSYTFDHLAQVTQDFAD